MILYQSNTDNLIIETRFDTIEMRYGQKVIDQYYSTGNPRKDARIARQWIIDNRWNGNV